MVSDKRYLKGLRTKIPTNDNLGGFVYSIALPNLVLCTLETDGGYGLLPCPTLRHCSLAWHPVTICLEVHRAK